MKVDYQTSDTRRKAKGPATGPKRKKLKTHNCTHDQYINGCPSVEVLGGVYNPPWSQGLKFADYIKQPRVEGAYPKLLISKEVARVVAAYLAGITLNR